MTRSPSKSLRNSAMSLRNATSTVTTSMLLLQLLQLPENVHTFNPATIHRYQNSVRTTTTLLYHRQDNDECISTVQRARINQLLEESMNDDWRYFRAQLIAQQQQQAGKFSDDVLLSSSHDDPFVSLDELPIHNNNKQGHIAADKDSWAHSLNHIEPGCVLIADPSAHPSDGMFQQTVVLIVDHCEFAGTTGVIINRPHGTFIDYATEYHFTNRDPCSNLDIAALTQAFPNAPMAFGGPYRPDIMTALHGYGNVSDKSKKLAPGVFIGGVDELAIVATDTDIVKPDIMFVKGYASWSPGQLYQEIDLGGFWHVAACSTDFILRYVGGGGGREEEVSSPPGGDISPDLWGDIMTCMGGEYADIALQTKAQAQQRQKHSSSTESETSSRNA